MHSVLQEVVDMAAGSFSALTNDFSTTSAHARVKAEFQADEIYLFGSHAWGVPTDDSDVDLMVIVRDSAEKAIRRMQRAHRCLSGLGFPKDVLVPTRSS